MRFKATKQQQPEVFIDSSESQTNEQGQLEHGSVNLPINVIECDSNSHWCVKKIEITADQKEGGLGAGDKSQHNKEDLNNHDDDCFSLKFVDKLNNITNYEKGSTNDKDIDEIRKDELCCKFANLDLNENIQPITLPEKCSNILLTSDFHDRDLRSRSPIRKQKVPFSTQIPPYNIGARSEHVAGPSHSITFTDPNQPNVLPIEQKLPIQNKNGSYAKQKLQELSESTDDHNKLYVTELVEVFMTAGSRDVVEEFRRHLLEKMTTMKVERPEDWDTWQLSIYAHIEFLMSRPEYHSVLLTKDNRGKSLFYIAAIERFERPLIARYIAESMLQLCHNPFQEDENGNTIFQILAHKGDSHIGVFSELLQVAEATDQLSIALKTNNRGESPVESAVLSPNVTTCTLKLLGAITTCFPPQSDSQETSQQVENVTNVISSQVLENELLTPDFTLTGDSSFSWLQHFL